MGRIDFAVLTVLFCLFASTYARTSFDLPLNEVIVDDLPSSLPESDTKPTESEPTTTIEFGPQTAETTADAVPITGDRLESETQTVDDVPVNRKFTIIRLLPENCEFPEEKQRNETMANSKVRRREVSYGKDVIIMSAERKDFDQEKSRDGVRSHRIRHHHERTPGFRLRSLRREQEADTEEGEEGRFANELRSDDARTLAKSTSKTIVLKPMDGEAFEVEAAVAMQSETFKRMLEDETYCPGTIILLPNVTSNVLAKVIEYCQRRIIEPIPKSELEKFDAEFVRVDHRILFDLILASHYLKINSLYDLTTQTVANMIMGKTREEICKMFNIKSNFTSQEEEGRCRENAW